MIQSEYNHIVKDTELNTDWTWSISFPEQNRSYYHMFRLPHVQYILKNIGYIAKTVILAHILALEISV